MEYINQSRLKKLRMRVEADTQFLPGSKKLKIRGRELDDLPAELFVMTDLEVLDLSPERQSCINYHLTEVPSAISRLTSLRVLMLDTNMIAQLPEAFTQLSNLEKLSLSNNCLTSLPDSFGKMKSLQSLHMANNDFENFPECVCELQNIHFLDLCDNRLLEIPESIQNMKKLESLFLFLNCLTSLPDGICELKELRSLWVGDNNITRLPRNISKLTNLDWGNSRHVASTVLDKNPLKHPPLYVCKQGLAAIENYFKVTDPQRANPQKTAKRPASDNNAQNDKAKDPPAEKKIDEGQKQVDKTDDEAKGEE